MDIDSAKENIQPLASGRNVGLLEFALNAESRRKVQEEIAAKRLEFEEQIKNYEGEDPLELWYEYISWIEQSFLRNGKDSALDESLQRCLKTFEHDQRYNQDRRMVALYIKFIDLQPNQHEYYNFLFNQGIGTMVADMYKCWAYYFEVLGNFERAEEIYQKGLGARAEPLEDLKQSHTQFLLMVAERNLYRDEDSNIKFQARMNEKRLALTSLHGQKKNKVVGSIRTGAAIKSLKPGLVEQENASFMANAQVSVFTTDASQMHSTAGPSEMKSVIDSAIKAHENKREPGPWSSAKKPSEKCTLFSKKEKQLANTALGFEICEDSMDGSSDMRGISLPPNFVSKNLPQDDPQFPLTIQEQSAAVPQYKKALCYPQTMPTEEYSPEELKAYKYWVQRMGHPQCRVIQELAEILDGAQLPHGFAKANLPQDVFEPPNDGFEGAANQMPMCVVLSGRSDKSYEELLKEKHLRMRKGVEKTKYENNMSLTMNSNSMDIEEDDMESSVFVTPPIRRQESSEPEFNMNETCSTQIFNLYIKPQQISTPNMDKKKRPVQLRSSLSLYRHTHPKVDDILESSVEEVQKLSIAEKEKPAAMVNELPMEPVVQPLCTTEGLVGLNGKQLSMIMETTENSMSSGGGQTIGAAGITKSTVDTRFYSTVYHDERQTTMTTSSSCSGVDLAAKPRKSILKNNQTFEEKLQVPVVEAADRDSEQAPPIPVYVDEPAAAPIKATTNATAGQFIVPAPPVAVAPSVSIPIYRDSLDFYNLNQTSEKNNEFAVPLPPKPKTFMPLYNDSMEQFFDKSKTGPSMMPAPVTGGSTKVHEVVAEQPREVENAVGGIPIFTDSMEVSRVAVNDQTRPDFSIFEDSVSHRGPLPVILGSSSSSGSQGVTMKSFHGSVQDENKMPETRDLESPDILSKPSTGSFGEMNFFDSPKKTVPWRDQSAKPASLELSAMEQSAHGRSVREVKESAPLTAGASLLGSTVKNKSVAMPSIRMDPMASFTLDSSMTKPSMREMTVTTTMNLKKLPQVENKSMLVAPVSQGGAFAMDESMTFNTLLKKGAVQAIDKSVITISDPTESANMGPVKRANVSIFSIKAKEDEKELENLDRSLSFNSLMKSEEMPQRQQPAVERNSIKMPATFEGNLSTTIFPTLPELPSSTVHGFPIVGVKGGVPTLAAPASAKHFLDLDNSLTALPMEPYDGEEAEDDNIYKWENTLRILPEAESVDSEWWYNHNLDGTANFHVDHSGSAGKQSSVEDKLISKSFGTRKPVDPFDMQLVNVMLDKADFVHYLEKVPECDMSEKIPPLKQGGQLQIVDRVFSVRKLIGKGAFGKIYSAKRDDGKLYALKQCKPCNLWEYYICMEVKCRIMEFDGELLNSFIDIEQAIVAKNASVFAIPFCPYGNLINICNEYKKHTSRNLHETIVMILSVQILTMIDALHACQIIHADIKPDNIMIVGPINTFNYYEPILKLIDFGQAIDMKMFPSNVEFCGSLATDGFTCTEMKEGRPWTYQTDLYCVAGTIHTMLFGKYMTVQKGVCGYGLKEKLPRYLQKIWEQIFGILLNVSNCQLMPNLQQLKLMLKEHLTTCEKTVGVEVRQFNKIVSQITVLDH